MAFIRCCILFAAMALCMQVAKAQIIYYPVGSSQLLKATAEDAAMLLQKAIPGSNFTTQPFSILPTQGIVLVYDSTITDNQACRIECNGTSLLKFTAAQDNGLCFGIYQYLGQLGFRFYQPGSIWEIIPTLTTPFKNINTTLSSSFKYKTWNLSGGHNRWIMDNNSNYGWDVYYGENGHNWALYQRRNSMMGGYRFAGHRNDIFTAAYLNTLQNNPCYIAAYNGQRNASVYAVPDMNNTAAMNLWGNTIEQKFAQYKNTVYSNTSLYANLYRNFDFYNSNIGLEVADGAQWGNSKDNTGCTGADYPKESDQHFTIANFAAQKINAAYPGKHFQLYAYNSHADVPSTGLSINNNIDVQVVATAFQNESSTKGLLNRWYGKTGNVSEYHYLNIPQWGGETPMFYLDEMKTTLQRVKEKNAQGIFWEASPAKFASLPFLLAANNNLIANTGIDSTLKTFCSEMFAGAGNTIYTLLQSWSDDKTISNGDFIQDNKYKLPLYHQLVKEAGSLTLTASSIVKERINELKAYLHYMVLYYDWLFDQRSQLDKQDKAAALCIYLARVNKLQLVNSYYLIADITSRFGNTSSFYQQYNVNNGTAYLNGNLPLITPAEIDNNFAADAVIQSNLAGQYKLETASFIKSRFSAAGMLPLKKITVKISYTNGFNYPNRAEYFIDAPAAGQFSIKYNAQFLMPEKGYINFTVESVNQSLQILKDLSIGRSDAATGEFTVNLPAAGVYKLSVVSKFQSGVDLAITTNGNYFYKNGAFLGNKTENYRPNLLSLPGYFYIPNGINKVYFSVNNSNPGGAGFANAEAISKAFVFKDNNGNTVQPELVNTSDSALFYLEIPATANGTFWQVFKMEQYNMCFANISNITWFAERAPCSNANFTIAIIKKNGDCITKLTAASNISSNLQWELYDLGRWTYFNNQSTVELPNYTSPNVVITLKNGKGCMVTKRPGDDAKYLKAKEACGSGAAVGFSQAVPVIYPNPSTGIFNCLQDNNVLIADEIMISNAQGLQVGSYKNVKQFNLSNLPAGMYWYHMVINEKGYNGKLVKL